MKGFLRVCTIMMLVLILLFGLCFCGTADMETVAILETGVYGATVLRTEKSTVLIDTGGEGDGSRIVNALANAGVEHVDLLVITRFDPAHVGGAEYLLHHIGVGMIYIPSQVSDPQSALEFDSVARMRGYLPITLDGDAVVTVDGVEYTLYVPDGGADGSVAVRAVSEDIKYLFD